MSLNNSKYVHFSIRKDTVEEDLSIFTVLKGDDRHKNKKIKHIIVKPIHSSFHSESKMYYDT